MGNNFEVYESEYNKEVLKKLDEIIDVLKDIEWRIKGE